MSSLWWRLDYTMAPQQQPCYFPTSCVKMLNIYTMLEISRMLFPHWCYFLQAQSILKKIEMAAESLEHQKKRLLLFSTHWESQPTLWFNIDNLTHKNPISSVISNLKAHITPLTDKDMLNELTFALIFYKFNMINFWIAGFSSLMLFWSTSQFIFKIMFMKFGNEKCILFWFYLLQ